MTDSTTPMAATAADFQAPWSETPTPVAGTLHATVEVGEAAADAE